MESKVIKVGSENYKWLVKLAGRIQQNESKPVSFDGAISTLKEEHERALIALKSEMKSWEEASLTDSISFWKKHKL